MSANPTQEISIYKLPINPRGRLPTQTLPLRCGRTGSDLKSRGTPDPRCGGRSNEGRGAQGGRQIKSGIQGVKTLLVTPKTVKIAARKLRDPINPEISELTPERNPLFLKIKFVIF